MLCCYNIDPPFRIKGLYTAIENRWNSEMAFNGESHDFWELVTVLSGQVEAVEDDRYYILDEGMMICHAPGEFHRIRSAGGTSPHFTVVTFRHEGELPPHLCDGAFCLDGDMMSEYMKIFLPLREFYSRARLAFKSGNAPPLACEAEIDSILGLEQFLLRLSRLDISEGERSMSASAREYRDLVRIMTERVRDNLSLAELASLRYISVSYVKKLFRTYAGEGAMSYYARLRVNEIKSLFDSGESATSVAELMNFSSGAYLSSFFKKHTGITPGDYMRRK